MLEPLYINIWPFGQCSKGITNSLPFLISTSEGHHLTSVDQNKIIHISTSNHSWHSVTSLISWKYHTYVTPKPSTELLHVVLIYNGLGNVTILVFLEFILYQSIVHPMQAIVLGLINVTYIGLMCNYICICNTYSQKWLMFSELNKT